MRTCLTMQQLLIEAISSEMTMNQPLTFEDELVAGTATARRCSVCVCARACVQYMCATW